MPVLRTRRTHRSHREKFISFRKCADIEFISCVKRSILTSIKQKCAVCEYWVVLYRLECIQNYSRAFVRSMCVVGFSVDRCLITLKCHWYIFIISHKIRSHLIITCNNIIKNTPNGTISTRTTYVCWVSRAQRVILSKRFTD